MASAAQQAGALSTQVLDQQQRLTEQEQQLAQSAAQARADSQTLAAERQRAAHQAETLQSSLAGAKRRAEEADASLVALQRRLNEVSAEQQVGRYRSLSGVWQHLWRCKLMGDCVPSCRLGLAKIVYGEALSSSWQAGWVCNSSCHANGSSGTADAESTLGDLAGMVLPRSKCLASM